MKARIEKKLSKRLRQLMPTVLGKTWIDSSEPSELAYKQGTCVSHVVSVGGGTDFMGDGEDAFTAWEWWLLNWEWHGDFIPYPEGHRHECYPNTERFKCHTLNLLKLAVVAERSAHAEKERIAKSRLAYARQTQRVPQ